MNFSATAGIGRARRGRGPRRQVRIHSPLRGAAVGCDNWVPTGTPVVVSAVPGRCPDGIKYSERTDTNRGQQAEARDEAEIEI